MKLDEGKAEITAGCDMEVYPCTVAKMNPEPQPLNPKLQLEFLFPYPCITLILPLYNAKDKIIHMDHCGLLGCGMSGNSHTRSPPLDVKFEG